MKKERRRKPKERGSSGGGIGEGDKSEVGGRGSQCEGRGDNRVGGEAVEVEWEEDEKWWRWSRRRWSRGDRLGKIYKKKETI